MPATPNITLTATLEDFTGAAAGSVANPAKLRIALCGFGPVLPRVTGTTMLARTGPFDEYSTGAALSITLFGNDQITPTGTYYSIEILDGEDNVVQCGAYIFTGSTTIDLSNAAQIVPGGYVPSLPQLKYLPCAGAVPGTIYTAPGPIVALFYNGVALPAGQALPTLSYTAVGNVATLNFTTQTGAPNDRIDALCVVT
jgi:hypothetical protein